MTLPEETRFQITLQDADYLTRELEQEIDTLDHLAFSGSGDVEEDSTEWVTSSTWYVLGRLDGRLVSQVGILERLIQAGGQPLSIAGVGGVATHPEFRRLGFAEALLQAALEQMRQRGGYDFAMLFCGTRMIPYYAKRGYHLVYNSLYILQSGQRVLFESDKMVLPLSGKPWPEGEVDVNGPPW